MEDIGTLGGSPGPDLFSGCTISSPQQPHRVAGGGLFLCPLDPHVLYPITQSPFHTPTPEETSQRPLRNHRVGFEPGSLEFKTAVLCCCPELGKAGVLRQHSMAGVCVGGDEGGAPFPLTSPKPSRAGTPQASTFDWSRQRQGTYLWSRASLLP